MADQHDLDNGIEKGSLKRHAVRGGATTIASQGAKFLVRVVSQIAVARLLTPADYGLVAMVAPVLALVQLVAELGLGQALVQRPTLRVSEISGLFWFGLGMNVTLALILAALSPLIALAYGEPRLVLIVLVLASLIPISASGMAHSALLTRKMRFGTQAVLDIVPPLVGVACGFTAALNHLGYWSLVIMTGAESLSRTTIVWVASNWRPSAPAYDPEIWSLVRVGGHVAGYNLATYITSSADNILLGLIGGKVELGLYDRGYKLVTQPIGQMLSPFARVAVPLMMRLKGDEARYRSAFLTMLQLVLLASMPALLFLMILAKPVVILLLGGKWVGVAPVISWFCLGGMASCVNTSTFWLFVTQERTQQQLKYVFGMSAMSLAAFAIGLPWGAVGVAAGGALSFLLVATPFVCWGATKYGPVQARHLIGAVFPLALAGMITVAVLYGVMRVQHLPVLLLLPAALVISYTTFSLGLLCLPAGRRLLRETWALKATLLKG